MLGDLEPFAAVMKLIESARINAVPGDLFYADPTGVRSMRFHFAVESAVLEEACARLRGLGEAR